MSPNMQKWREQTSAIVNKLVADGSDPESLYGIEHHFACHQLDCLQRLAIELFRAGFEVTDAEEMERDDGTLILRFDGIIEGKLDVDWIARDIEKILPMVERYGVDYDGWGCAG